MSIELLAGRLGIAERLEIRARLIAMVLGLADLLLELADLRLDLGLSVALRDRRGALAGGDAGRELLEPVVALLEELL